MIDLRLGQSAWYKFEVWSICWFSTQQKFSALTSFLPSAGGHMLDSENACYLHDKSRCLSGALWSLLHFLAQYFRVWFILRKSFLLWEQEDSDIFPFLFYQHSHSRGDHRPQWPEEWAVLIGRLWSCAVMVWMFCLSPNSCWNSNPPALETRLLGCDQIKNEKSSWMDGIHTFRKRTLDRWLTSSIMWGTPRQLAM